MTLSESDRSISSAGASPVKTCHSQESRAASTPVDPGFSSTSCESFAWFDHDTSCWRTYQRCFLDPTGWEQFSGRWPRAGSMRNGIASPRKPSAPITGATGSSSWPTPQARDGSGPQGQAYKGTSFDLPAAVRMWPTPTANDSKPAGGAELAEYGTPGARTTVNRLRVAAAHGLPPSEHGALSPRWVEWLMGFPPGWTDCED